MQGILTKWVNDARCLHASEMGACGGACSGSQSCSVCCTVCTLLSVPLRVIMYVRASRGSMMIHDEVRVVLSLCVYLGGQFSAP